MSNILMDRLLFLYTSLLMDPVEADFYWVPHSLIGHWIGCYETNTSRELQTCDAPTGQRWESGKDYWNRALRPFLSHIVYGLPFFNASNGEDHLFLYTSGNGPICESAALFHASFLSDAFFKWVVHRMLIIGSHGTYDMKIPIGPDTTYSTHRSSRDRKTCFRPGFDIALPQYRPSFKNRDGESELHDCLDSRACSEWVQFLRAKAARIRHAFYFKGSFRQLLGWCSPGIRSYLKGFCSPQNSCTTTRLGGIFSLAPAGTARPVAVDQFTRASRAAELDAWPAAKPSDWEARALSTEKRNHEFSAWCVAVCSQWETLFSSICLADDTATISSKARPSA